MNSTARKNTMQKAFDLVCPREHAKALAEAGLISPEAADKVSWKDPIAALVTDDALATAGVTIEQVRDSIVFFTATPPRVTRELIAGTSLQRFEEPRPGYLVIATGYRLGPAGDN